jgi:hypothetical protein
MPNSEPTPVTGHPTGHVDGHGPIDPTPQESSREARVAPDLLGHRKDFQPQPVRLVADCSRVGLHGVEIEHVGVRRNAALPV